MLSSINLVAVAIGGALGSVLRYCTAMFAQQLSPGSELPWGTIAVNLVGCFLIGTVVEYSARQDFLSRELQLLLVTGFLGGFTTFSAFGLETVGIANRSLSLAALNVVLSVAGGLFAVIIGMKLVRSLL